MGFVEEEEEGQREVPFGCSFHSSINFHWAPSFPGLRTLVPLANSKSNSGNADLPSNYSLIKARDHREESMRDCLFEDAD